jgi:predicted ATPase
VKSTGDGIHAAFATAWAAVGAALDAQRALQREAWGTTGALRVRMGLHTGAAEARGGDYYGTAVNRAARLMAVAHGGQVVCSQVTADLMRDELDGDIALVDLGEHRLRDLETAERVFQITHAELRSEFPALRSLDAFPGNLPVQVSAFVGREEELAAVTDLLARERLVTLTGTGGVGKTRLAVQAAAAVLPRFPDGAWFVDLAPVGDPEFVAGEITTTIGLLEHRRATPEEALVRAIAHRNLLLVFDNCEHVVDVTAGLADQIVRRCPGVTVLATSQESLGVDGESTYAVRPLGGNDSSRLFVTRAAAVRHGFELTAENSATVAELCRRLDGIPLAIELAAARVASMSPAAILERVDERFRLLAQGRRTARSRHQTLRAAVDWSYQLLAAAEQLVFARLSVFAGAFTLEAAESVVADEQVDSIDVLDILGGLVTKSMVTLDDTGALDRYRLTETMRDYAHQLLADREELQHFEQRHAAHYLRLAQEAGPHLIGADDRPWLERLDTEYPDVRAAITFLRELTDRADQARLVFALARFWWYLGMQHEGLEWITSVLDVPFDAPPRQRGEVLALAALMAMDLDRYDLGVDLIEQSLACSKNANEPPVAQALGTLAMSALVQNRPEDTFRYGEEAIAVARADGDPYRLCEALANVSGFFGVTVDDRRGIDLADEALAIARQLGNSYLLVVCLLSAGITRYRADPARAIELLSESTSSSTLRNNSRISQSHFWMSLAHLRLRDDAATARELCVALPLMQESGEPYFESMALAVAAIVLSRRDPDLAVRILALIDRMRDDEQFIGASRDLQAQDVLRTRLEQRLQPEHFAALWAEGRSMTLDDTIAITLDELARIAQTE